jgi:hypothetical protein
MHEPVINGHNQKAFELVVFRTLIGEQKIVVIAAQREEPGTVVLVKYALRHQVAKYRPAARSCGHCPHDQELTTKKTLWRTIPSYGHHVV